MAAPRNISHEYMLRCDEQAPFSGGFEILLYSDCYIVGMVQVGPFEFLNNVCRSSYGGNAATPVLTLRVSDHTTREKDWRSLKRKSDFDAYHGGGLAEELSSLASLLLGFRLKPGATTRLFGANDARGTPIMHALSPEPFLPDFRATEAGIDKLPYHRRRIDISPLSKISGILRNAGPELEAIIKAARLYQQAVWLANIQPDISWVQLVSAIEVCASFAESEGTYSLHDLEVHYPRLKAFLEKSEIDNDLPAILNEIGARSKSAKKFKQFIIANHQGPREIRPAEWMQLDYNKRKLEEFVSTIYSHRSRFLHSGTSFPGPMCEAPFSNDDKIYAEIPIGLGAGNSSAWWEKRDMPMMLHEFEHIVRSSILNWTNRILLNRHNAI